MSEGYEIKCGANYTITFELTDDKFVIICQDDDPVFCIRNDTICMYQFINAMQFFECFNTQDDFSGAFIGYCLEWPKYSVERLNELTGYVLAHKLREIVNTIKLEEHDMGRQKICEALKELFPEDNSIKLAFID
jgi:hypothetical protein